MHEWSMTLSDCCLYVKHPEKLLGTKFCRSLTSQADALLSTYQILGETDPWWDWLLGADSQGQIRSTGHLSAKQMVFCMWKFVHMCGRVSVSL